MVLRRVGRLNSAKIRVKEPLANYRYSFVAYIRNVHGLPSF